jgi:hypothetical protein
VSGLHDRSTVLGFGVGQDELGQMLRLRRFREKHPDVIIGDGGFGTFQARIPEENGETVTTRYSLRELLDKLCELTAGHDSQPS